MGYRVIRYFTDLRDNNYEYHVGDLFPHDGLKVGKVRLDELASDKNRRGIPLIEKIAEEAKAEAESDPAKEEVVDTDKPKKKRAKKNAE